jgi:hydrogenase expression/formation protein HypE
MADTFTIACPTPIAGRERVVLAHGGGGRMMHQLLEQFVYPAFSSSQLDRRHDGAVLSGASRLAFTTDSYVVHPLFFPGGDIGALAINGTVNDLAMCGARPEWLSVAFIIEEGLPLETLRAVITSMQQAAAQAGVSIVTGDTKVVDRGKGDGLFVNTAGIGIVEHGLEISPAAVRPGDAVLVSGDVGRHGAAILAVRAGVEFESTIESDCGSLAQPVLSLIEAGIEVHCLRDLTRGGLATGLIEIAEHSGLHIKVDEELIAVEQNVRGACELLGLDPLYLANEGRMVVFVPEAQQEPALKILRQHAISAGAEKIGHVCTEPIPMVTARSSIGTQRILDMQSGEQLPRIC